MNPEQGNHYFTRSQGKYPPQPYRPPVIVKRCEMNLKSEEDRLFGPRVVERYIDSVVFGKIKLE